MGIMSNDDLHLTFCRTREDHDLETRFMNKFDEASRGYSITVKQLCFFRNTAMYMNVQCNYDHKYFQRTIKRDIRMNPDIGDPEKAQTRNERIHRYDCASNK